MKLTRFEDLDCWKESRIFTKMVYEATNNSSFKKDLRLSGQIQAAATSTMANCAEGFKRRSNKEFIQFLFIAISSVAEVQSHLYVSFDQGYINQESFQKIYEQAEKTSRLISGLINYLRTNERRYQQEKRQKSKKP